MVVGTSLETFLFQGGSRKLRLSKGLEESGPNWTRTAQHKHSPSRTDGVFVQNLSISESKTAAFIQSLGECLTANQVECIDAALKRNGVALFDFEALAL